MRLSVRKTTIFTRVLGTRELRPTRLFSKSVQVSVIIKLLLKGISTLD